MLTNEHNKEVGGGRDKEAITDENEKGPTKLTKNNLIGKSFKNIAVHEPGLRKGLGFLRGLGRRNIYPR